MNILLVMIGGFFGAITRYGIGEWVHINNGFPLGTFFINLTGSLVLGWLLTFISQRRKAMKRLSLFVGTGFLGSFTTFSTFSVETIYLIVNKDYFLAIIYVLLSVTLGLVFAFLGYKLATLNNKEKVDVL
ncbi:fluoride efflux transporter CrcB [Bacillus sp. FJAT-49705]|uniref:Fluoride-specific ion channel FluC n=1 Tax=Cytobacillus citreus TaxID=2833586 RepID=A0ABS5NSL7_9BACI|nr:fluoride efflux transporter CrcB [Cytobacillus citreus]MBS4190817.1 fluoride efflux transporter CrcB [Cytobacillus citreus]